MKKLIHRYHAIDPPSGAPARRPCCGRCGRAGLFLACWPVAAVLAAAVLVAGCGGSNSTGGSVAHVGTTSKSAKGAAKSPAKSDPLAFAECMRKHGVPDFPDPTSSGQLQLPSGMTTSSPAFEKGAKVCGYLIGGATAPKPITQNPQTQGAALKMAECMRSHGVPNFPDGPITKSSGINQNSPAFQRAFQKCSKDLAGQVPSSPSGQVPDSSGG